MLFVEKPLSLKKAKLRIVCLSLLTFQTFALFPLVSQAAPTYDFKGRSTSDKEHKISRWINWFTFGKFGEYAGQKVMVGSWVDKITKSPSERIRQEISRFSNADKASSDLAKLGLIGAEKTDAIQFLTLNKDVKKGYLNFEIRLKASQKTEGELSENSTQDEWMDTYEQSITKSLMQILATDSLGKDETRSEESLKAFTYTTGKDKAGNHRSSSAIHLTETFIDENKNPIRVIRFRALGENDVVIKAAIRLAIREEGNKRLYNEAARARKAELVNVVSNKADPAKTVKTEAKKMRLLEKILSDFNSANLTSNTVFDVAKAEAAVALPNAGVVIPENDMNSVRSGQAEYVVTTIEPGNNKPVIIEIRIEKEHEAQVKALIDNFKWNALVFMLETSKNGKATDLELADLSSELTEISKDSSFLQLKRVKGLQAEKPEMITVTFTAKNLTPEIWNTIVLRHGAISPTLMNKIESNISGLSSTFPGQPPASPQP